MLSPIGGQASLRLLSAGNYTTTETFIYSKPEELVDYWDNDRYWAAQKSLLNSLWVSHLITKSGSGADTWNGISIPLIEPLEADTTRRSDDDGWYDVPDWSDEYAALVSIPFGFTVKTSEDVDGTAMSVPIEAWYWTLDCHNLTSDRMWILQQSMAVASTSGPRSNLNWSAGACDTSSGTGCLLTNIDIEVEPLRRPDDANLPLRHIFLSTESDYFNMTSGHPADKSGHLDGSLNSSYLETPDGHHSMSAGICSISTVYVEAELYCIGENCGVKRVRRSLSPSAVPSWTVFDCLECNGTLQFTTLAHMFTTSLTSTAFNPTLVSFYMA